jgi:hypothetical protein
MIITSGQGTNVITVTIPANFQHGEVKVKASNCKGTGGERKKDIKGGTLGNAVVPNGPSTVCRNSTKNYSTSAPGTGPITFTWTANNGAIVQNGQGTPNAGIRFNGATSTTVTITVTASNSYCGSSATASKTVTVNLTCREAITESSPVTVESFNAYPNPTSGKATITFNSSTSEKYSIRVVDMIGRTIITDISNAIEGYNMKEIDLQKASKGIYLVSIQSESGEVHTLRLIVE